MFATYTKSQSLVFKELSDRGEDLYIDGDGFHYNALVFDTFREFFSFCKDQLDK